MGKPCGDSFALHFNVEFKKKFESFEATFAQVCECTFLCLSILVRV
jgi:hypothetical protein